MSGQPPGVVGEPEHTPLHEVLRQLAHHLEHEGQVIERAAKDADEANVRHGTVTKIEDSADAIDDAAESVEEAADATEDATRAAEEDVRAAEDNRPQDAEEAAAAAETVEHGNPFAGFANFDDCVNRIRQGKPDVEDPEAYCASIKRAVEGNPALDELFAERFQTPAEPEPEPKPKPKPKAKPPEKDRQPKEQHWYYKPLWGGRR